MDNIKGQADEHDVHITPSGVQNLCIFHEKERIWLGKSTKVRIKTKAMPRVMVMMF